MSENFPKFFKLLFFFFCLCWTFYFNFMASYLMFHPYHSSLLLHPSLSPPSIFYRKAHLLESIQLWELGVTRYLFYIIVHRSFWFSFSNLIFTWPAAQVQHDSPAHETQGGRSCRFLDELFPQSAWESWTETAQLWNRQV